MNEEKKPAATATPDERWLNDPDTVRAVLAVHRNLELPALLEALLAPCVKWSGALCGFALGPGGEEGKLYVPLASAPRSRDERAKAYAGVDPVRLEALLAEGPATFEGLGPFAIADGWRDTTPARSWAIPIDGVAHGRAGALVLLFDELPGAETRERIDRFLDAVRPAIDNILQVQAMRELVIKDDTASCFNRRYFEQCMPEELSRAGRFRSALSLIFLDMDNLKQVNNEHGHAMGSRTLYEVSVRVRSKIRKFDKLFRFGGDEFCIVLPETEWSGAKEVAERVREAISTRPFLNRELNGTGVHMTASLGIASYPLHARTQQDLIQLADRAMQTVKRGTKDGVGIADSGGQSDE